MIRSINKIGADIKGIFIAIDKGDNVQKIRMEHDFDIHTMVKIEIRNKDIILKS